MGALSPTHWLIIAGVVVLLFGAKKMPDFARSMGQSMRILKAETSELRADSSTTPTGAPSGSAPASIAAPAQPAPAQPAPAQPAAANPTAAAPMQPAQTPAQSAGTPPTPS